MMFSLTNHASDPLADMDLGGDKDDQRPWQINAFVESRSQFFADDLGILSTRQSQWAELDYRKNSWRGLLSGSVEYDPARKLYDDDVRLRFNEGYLSYQYKDWTVTLGGKRVTLGTADGRNTFDLINPIDLRDPLVTGRFNTRLGSSLIGLEWSSGQQAVELWLLPKAAVNRQPRFNSPWEPSSLNQLRSAARQGNVVFNEANKPKQAEVALRFSHHGQGHDYSLLFFDGYIDDPLLLQDVNGDFFTKYRRYRAYGLQSAVGLGKSTLRSEFAYKPNLPLASSEARLTQANLYQLIVGWDRNFSATFYTNLQFFYDHVSGSVADDRYGLTYSISDKFWQEDLQIGVRGLWDASSNEYAAELFTEYRHDDQWSFKAGRYWINGEQNTLLRDFHRNEFFYLNVNYQF